MAKPTRTRKAVRQRRARPATTKTRVKKTLAKPKIPRRNAVRRVFRLGRVQAPDSGGEVVRTIVRDVDRYTADALYFARHFDFTGRDLEENFATLRAGAGFRGPVRTALWFVPHFLYPYYGGIHTILRFADYLARRHGVQNTFAVQGVYDVRENARMAAEAFPALADSRFVPLPEDRFVDSLEPHDVGICTAWQTAYPLLKDNRVKRKLYFMQDFEPLFYPAGSVYGLAEETYRFGFDGICNTPSLQALYERYGGRAVAFRPSVDRDVFYPPADKRHVGSNVRLFFYGRPFGIRNGFETAAEALKIVKRRFGGAIEIVSAGGDWNPADYGLEGVVTNLGRLPYRRTADLFRTCHIGLTLMMTPHTSYLPLELMACGCVVVTNGSPWKEWLLKDGSNCLFAQPVPSRIAETVARAVENPDLRRELSRRALEDAAAWPDWDAEFDRVMGELFGK